MADSTQHRDASVETPRRQPAAEPGSTVVQHRSTGSVDAGIAGWQAAVTGSPRMLAQRRAIDAAFGVVQAKGAGGVKIGFSFENGDEKERPDGKALVQKVWRDAKDARRHRKATWMQGNLGKANGLAGKYVAALEGEEEEKSLFLKQLESAPALSYSAPTGTISYKAEGMADALPIATLVTGADIYKAKPLKEGAEAPARALFEKEGLADKEYVKDKRGTYTRRYAYVEKNFYQMMDFFKTGTMTGRFQQATTAAGGAAPAQQPTPKANTIVKGPAPVTLSTEQIAVAHQYMGSSSEQRGLSLTSTEKVGGTVGNEGKNFREKDGFRLKIDLARVPDDVLLINHYSDQGVISKDLDASNIKGMTTNTAAKGRNKYKYGASVTKNRELFLEKLRPEWVVEVEHHPASGGYGTGVGTVTPLASGSAFGDLGATYAAYWVAFDATLKGQPAEADAVSQKGKNSALLMQEGYLAGEAAFKVKEPAKAREVEGADKRLALTAHGDLQGFDEAAKEAGESDKTGLRKQGYVQWQLGYVRGRAGLPLFADSAAYAKAMSQSDGAV